MAKYSKIKKFNYEKNKSEDILEFWTKEPHRYTKTQREIVEKRLTTDYVSLKNKRISRSKEELKFDCNKEFYIETPFNAKNFPGLYKEPLKQEYVIPFSQENYNKVLSLPKFKLFTHTFQQNKDKEKYYFTVTYYCGKLDGKYVVLATTVKTNNLEDRNDHCKNSISTHLLLQGYEPLLLSRFDTFPASHHPNKLDKNGKLSYDKNHIKGPHEHIYDERLAVVFPFQRFVGHYDAKSMPKFEHLSQAERYLSEKVFYDTKEIFTNIPKHKILDNENEQKRSENEQTNI